MSIEAFNSLATSLNTFISAASFSPASSSGLFVIFFPLGDSVRVSAGTAVQLVVAFPSKFINLSSVPFVPV
jgi:hypothetical protein